MKNYKLNEVEYCATDFEAVQKQIDELTQKAREVEENDLGFDALVEVIDAYDKLKSDLVLQENLTGFRCFSDCTDAFYAEAMEEESVGNAGLQYAQLQELICNSRYQKKLEEKYGECFIPTLKSKVETTKNGQELLEKEQEIMAKMQQVMASLKATYEGKSYSVAELTALYDELDRSVRIASRKAVYEAYLEQKNELLGMLKELVVLRDQIAKVNGFSNYIDYQNVCRLRFGYGTKELQSFCEAVKTYFVPLKRKIVAQQMKNMQLDQMMIYDQGLQFADGMPKPIGDASELIKAAHNMYHDMAEEIGEFFDRLVETQSINVESSPNKVAGLGFSAFLGKDYYCAVFGNCNGTLGDVSVFTHEIAHAWQKYKSVMAGLAFDLTGASEEIAEIPSKTMEFFTYQYAREFFGEDAEKYVKSHFTDVISEVLSYCMMHEFEVYLYTHTEASVEEWIEKFNEYDKMYNTDKSYGELEVQVEQGSLLLSTMTAMTFPVYLISYSVSLMCALNFYAMMRKDKESTWEKYCELCAAGGSLYYPNLLARVNMKPAYEEQVVKEMAEFAEQELYELGILER